MNIKYLLFAFLFTQPLTAQNLIAVCEQTIEIKPNGYQTLYFGFAEGDQIVFELEVLQRDELDYVNVFENDTVSRFKQERVKKIEDARINVTEKNVYSFRFINKDRRDSKKVKVRIQRVPGSDETITFPTAVKWIEKPDTVFLDKIGQLPNFFDTIDEDFFRRKVESFHLEMVVALDTVLIVPATQGKDISIAKLGFSFPERVFPKDDERYQTRATIACVYSLNVGDDEEWLNKANQLAINRKVICPVADSAFYNSPYAAMAEYGLERRNEFRDMPTGDDLWYLLQSDRPNSNYFHAGFIGAVVRDVPDIYTPGHHFQFNNRSQWHDKTVHIRVIAVIAEKNWVKYDLRGAGPVRRRPEEKMGLKVAYVRKTPVFDQ